VVVHLSAREAWQIRLDDGVVLELGRDQPKHPLAETPEPLYGPLPRSQRRGQDRLQAVGVVDMRYPNGFALRAGKS
jgi:cell division protein FtsQ